jgi:hypothetical protein
MPCPPSPQFRLDGSIGHILSICDINPSVIPNMSANAPPASASDLEALARARFPDFKPAEVALVTRTKGDPGVPKPRLPPWQRKE